MVWSTRLVAAAGVMSLVALIPTTGEAQRPGARLGRFEVPGFDFTPDGAWRKRANAVRAVRRSLLRSGQIDALNASAMTVNQLTGTVNVPVALIQFSNVAGPFAQARYDSLLFDSPAVSRPYSYRSFYEEISNQNITIDGTVFNWVTAVQTDAYYEDGCNAIGPGCSSPIAGVGVSMRFRDLLVETIDALDDGSIDWGQFDNDGSDNVPNSGDDDGVVDFIVFLHPEVDGACGTTNIWAHRFSLSSLGAGAGGVATSTTSAEGGPIRINDYIIQSGQGGGNQGCNPGLIMQMGTLAHETGHAFGLPDLYDTSNNTEGVGEWGLMGSGNYARAYSPASMEAWSLVELGWVAVDTLTASETVTLNPVATSDTVLYVPLLGTDEYLLLENRDSLQSDTAQMAINGSTRKAPGLLIWHIDQSVVNSGMNFNSVNAGAVHGVALEQADGLNQLRCTTSQCGNRGDVGDVYPGSTVNRKWSNTSNPGSRNNAGGYAGFIIDSIYRNASGVSNAPSPIVFRFVKRTQSVFTTNRTGASIIVNSLTTTRFDDVVAQGDNVNLEAISPQTITSGRTQLAFASWSDGNSNAIRTIVSGVQPDTLVASFAANHKVNLVSAPTGGTVASNIAGTPDLVVGAFVAEGTPVTLTATADVGATFVRFQGDTTTTNPTLVLPMGRPYSLSAVFAGGVTIVTQNAVNALLSVNCSPSPCMSSQQLTYMDQTGNNDGSYNLGDFLAYADRTGLNPSSEMMQRLLSQPTISVPLQAPTTPKER